MARERECFVCGCTEDRACPGGCAWAKPPIGAGGRDICTRCATILERLKPYRAELTVKGQELSPEECAAFGLGVRATIRIINELESGR